MEQAHRHFIIHKPFGFISQFVCNVKNKKLLGELFDFPENTMAIGRLDEDSEGLLLLTTNGGLSQLVRSKKIEKEYHVQVDGIATQSQIDLLKKGVEIGIKGTKYQTLPCHVYVLNPAPNFEPRIKKIRDERHGPTSWISITLTEGKFRQVRKMTAAVGLPTLRLFRVRIGNMHLHPLKPSEVQEVSQFDF